MLLVLHDALDAPDVRDAPDVPEVFDAPDALDGADAFDSRAPDCFHPFEPPDASDCPYVDIPDTFHAPQACNPPEILDACDRCFMYAQELGFGFVARPLMEACVLILC